MRQGSSARQDLVFEDVVVGQSWRTSAHRVSDKDIAAFAEVTHDRHPLHVDDAFAHSMGFPRRTAHRLSGLSLMEGLKSRLSLYEHTSIASLGWDKVMFRHPIVSGDTVQARRRSSPNANPPNPIEASSSKVSSLSAILGVALIEAEHAANEK
jgi:acyl dehydratase